MQLQERMPQLQKRATDHSQRLVLDVLETGEWFDAIMFPSVNPTLLDIDE